MKNKTLYWLWAWLYALCTIFGFVPVAEGVWFGLLVLLSIAFFIPPAILLYRAIKQGRQETLRLIRTLALCSLGATLALMVLNIMTVGASEAIGNALYWALIVVSAPMVCGRIWGISLFLWACLLMVAARELRKKNKK